MTTDCSALTANSVSKHTHGQFSCVCVCVCVCAWHEASQGKSASIRHQVKRKRPTQRTTAFLHASKTKLTSVYTRDTQ